MGKFTATTVERIEWDFTDVPHRDTGEQIEHPAITGVLPEPSPKAMQEFLESSQLVNESAAVLFSLATGQEIHESLKHTHKAIAKDAGTQSAKVTADHCYSFAVSRQEQTLGELGVPLDLVQQLPARHLRAFFDFVTEELAGEGGSSSSDGSAS